MTQDEIIEMAREAKAIPMHKDFNQLALIGTENIEAFSKLVAEKEREAWSKVCEDIRKVFNEKADLAYIAGQKEEREACAKICDAFQERDVGMQPAECAGAIRARGQA